MPPQPPWPNPAEPSRPSSANSRRNLETHARGVQAINARELPDELFEQLCTPEFRLENTSTAVTDKTYHGAAGVREWISDFFDAFDPYARHEIEKVLATGEDFVVAVVRISGHGARSEAPLTLRWVNVTRFEAGRMASATGYLSRHEALAAVGLKETR